MLSMNSNITRMHKKTFLVFLIIVLISVVFSFKDNMPFEMHQQNPEDTDSTFTNNKKTRTSEKENFQLYDFLESVRDAFSLIKQFTTDFFNVFVLRKTKTVQKSSIIYRENFASQNGGAQILMVSSSKIKSPKAILRSNSDAYLFTADVLPITIVVALKEQILVDSFAIQSGEAYSCITNDFMLEGTFSLENSEWMFLGNFTAQNSFETQEFAVQQKIVRYIRLTILSSYGKWKYFTLSQIKVYGEGLFSHAMESLLQTQYSTQSRLIINGTEKKENQQIKNHNQGKSHKKTIEASEIETKQILVEAFQEIVIEGKKNITIAKDMNNSSKLTDENEFIADEIKDNDSKQTTQKPAAKDKKSISILKKKISYLEKRNFELNQDLKRLRNVVDQRLFELQTTGSIQSGNRKEHNGKWYNYLMSSQLVVIISMVINISCLVLVGLVFKRKLFPSRMSQSSQLNNSQERNPTAINQVGNTQHKNEEELSLKENKGQITQQNGENKQKSH